MPPSLVRAHRLAIPSNEPEAHLDDLVQRLEHHLPENAKVFGITYKDDSTLERIRQRYGRCQPLRLDMADDLAITDPAAGLETIQEAIDAPRAATLIRKHGEADLVVARHLLEHAHHPARFLRALRTLLAPEGRLLLEVPESTKFLSVGDHPCIWEEHVCYFTRATIEVMIEQNGLRIEQILCYPYPLEDSLVVIARACGRAHGKRPTPSPILRRERERCSGFAESFRARKERCQKLLHSLHAAGTRVALFGAGHAAVRFVNLYDLGGCIDHVIDDHPAKEGLCMPGSHLPIVDSSHLARADLVLLAVNPEGEDRVRAAHAAHLPGRGRCASIFSCSPTALL